MSKRTNKRNNWPLLPIAAGVLLLAAGVISLLTMGSGALPGAAPTATEDITYPNVPRVTIEEAKAALDAGTAVFVDVRGPGAFAVGRIPGSILIPVVDFESRVAELDPQDWIITYCT